MVNNTTSSQNGYFSFANMATHTGRLGSFSGWSYEYPPIMLSRAGFHWTGMLDTVQCYACGVKISDWKSNDNAKEKHKIACPSCPIIVNLMSIDGGHFHFVGDKDTITSKHPPHDVECMEIGDSFGNISDVIDIREYKKLKRIRQPIKEFASTYARELSFRGCDWPKHLTAQPKTLAQAGFFFCSIKPTKVKCFSCHSIIKNWNVKDTPLEEHTSLVPWCAYVQKVNTNEFLKYDLQIKIPSKIPGGVKPLTVMVKKEAKIYEDASYVNTDDIHFKTFKRLNYDFSLVSKGRSLAADKDCMIDISHMMEIVQFLESDDNRSQKMSDSEQKAIENKGYKTLDRGFQKLKNELTEDIDKLTHQILCKICIENQIDTVLLRCKHLVVCNSCAEKIDYCPVCRRTIFASMKVFIN
jgi:hypothetical protein